MKIRNILLRLSALSIVILGLIACMREEIPSGMTVPEGTPVDIALSFGGPKADIDIQATKSTLKYGPENKVFNIYVFIFDMDKDGQKMYAHYFDYNNMSTTGASTMSDWWEVSNSDTEGTPSSGKIHLHTVSKPNCKVVAVTNIDAEMVNISPEQLGSVEKYSDIYNQKAKLNQLITSRSGYFPMSGELGPVNTGSTDSWGTLVFRRLDAKIKFEMYVDLTLDEDGNPVSRIAEFKPLKWEVINIPKQAYVIEHGNYAEGHLTAEQRAAIKDACTQDEDYFNLGETNFETEELTDYYYAGTTLYKKIKHGFSFYMMENRKGLKNSGVAPSNFQERELQEKENQQMLPGGIASTTNGDFVYPEDNATYVVVTGRLRMNNVEYGTTSGATLSADVRYVVHLGDFSGEKWEDYNVFRNHTYTYRVIIRDVNDIRTEVVNNYEGTTIEEKIDENEPGASGSVAVALEEIFTSDAHYGSHVISFHAKHVQADKVTWMVKTPFNPSGASPVVTNGVENTSGLDYKWVEFRVNDMNEEGVYFADKRQVYLPQEGEYADGKTMNISALVSYLKKQKALYDQGLPNDFDATPDEDGGPKIVVTAFVNEYYYELNPITGEYQKDLWKKFVNQPMRFMYILSEVKTSADGESRILGSSFTIQQKSIQTIYSIDNEELLSAWGAEHTDDEMENRLFYYDKSGGDNRKNDSHSNGRENTLKEWTMINPNGTNRVLGDELEEEAYWHHYMNLTANNETPLMLSDYQYLRYSCMSRNRDLNGNGVIDQDEVRWYMGAHNQLIGLFMGSYGIEGDARLYQRNAQDKASNKAEVWRQHVIASTRYSGSSSNGPYVIWGEEGLSAGDPAGSKSWANGLNKFSTRCLRNLGYDPDTDNDITFSPYTTVPEDYIVMTRMKNGEVYTGAYDDDVYYQFDCTRLNKASRRYYTNRELVQHNENDEQSCLYDCFVVPPVKQCITVDNVPAIKGKTNIKDINEYLNANIADNPYCPPGYRLPNVREISIIRDFIPSNEVARYIGNNNFAPSRTYWSFGVIGEFYKSVLGNRYGWGAASSKVHMFEQGNKQCTYSVRCVKDVKQD